MEPYWSEANGHAPHSVKYESEAAVSSFPYCTESSLNFSTSGTTYSEDDAEYATGRRNKTSRQDPLSHRIIEKRRRDRMNSCLADLSRLIPPQYQRKGRGRIEKTEIIEMAIRHLKHLQSECMQKDNEYRLGYTDCMKEAAKFLYDSQMQDFCYRLIARLQEHCDELMKNDCFKSRNCHAADNVSASSGSPHQGYHSAPPLCQLRDMLGTSDIEHSNDHNDVKDLSFRNHLNQLQRNNLNGGGGTNGTTEPSVNSSSAASSSGQTNNNATASSSVISTTTITNNNNNNGSSNNSNSTLSQQPHQAAVITSTAPASLNHHTDHTDSSNHDFDSSREPLLHTDTSNMHSPPPRDAVHHLHPLHHHQHNHLNHHHHHHPAESLLMQSSRMRNFSESSHDIEHNNNYKYKNHIKERFNHELHDEETSSEHCPVPPMLQSEHSHTHSMSEHSKDGTEPDVAPIIAKKRKLAAQSESDQATSDTVNDIIVRSSATGSARPPTTVALTSLLSSSNSTAGRIEEKPFCFSDIKTELTTSTVGSRAHQQHISGGVPSSSTNTPPQQQQLTSQPPQRSFAVPIFALHGQGTYYVPLNVDYSILIPFLNGMDLLEKNYTSMPVVHPININVNFMPTTPSASLLAAAAAAAAVAAGKQQPPPLAGNAAAAAAKAKLEAITNGW